MRTKPRWIVLVLAVVAAIAALVLLVHPFGGRGGKQAAGPTAGKSGHGKEGRTRAPDEERERDEPILLVDDDPPGTLVLEGIVLDADDHPVPGAEVTVSSSPPRSAKTEGDGSFSFDKLLARNYRVVARAEAGIAGPVSTRLTATSDPVTLRLKPAASLEVTVVGAADKRPIAGASVELRDLATLTATTGDDGKALFQNVSPGGWQLVAWGTGFGKSFRWVGIPRAEVTEKETLELRPGGPVSGRVVAAGKPVEGAVVTFEGVAEWNADADPRRDAVQSDASGAFRFDAIPAGTYRFAARHKDFAPGTSALVTLDGASERSGVEISLDPGAVLAGQVVTKDGKPVPGATVRAAASSRRWSADAARVAVAGADGRFELSGLPRKPTQIVAVAEEGSSETAEVDLAAVPEKRDLTLTLELDGAIAGVVVDGAGEPIPEAQVVALPDLRGERGARAAARFEWRLRGVEPARADAGGRFKITGLRDGDYLVRATRPGQGGMMGRGMLREGTPASVGDTDVKVVLEAEGGVKGKVLLSDGTAPSLFLVGFGMGGGTPFSSQDGSFQLDDIPPGDRTLSISGPDFDRTQVRVTIESDKVADVGTISVTRGRSISGRVLTPQGAPVAGATVTAARRLFGDGTTAGGGRGGGFGRGGVGSRSATSDGDGGYTIYGVGPRELAIVAEHETLGRSTTLMIPPSNEPVQLDLVVQPFCALQGVVTKGGAPLEGTMVNVTSKTAPATNFLVTTGPDGAFRFDRLAPDTYLVQATEGSNPLLGIAFHTQVVTLLPGQTQSVAIAIPDNKGSLQVAVTQVNGGTVRLAEIHTLPGTAHSRTAHDLMLESAAAGGLAALSFQLGGLPATVSNLAPGAYSVCAVPYPDEVRGAQGAGEYRDREGDNMPCFCVPVQATDQPDQKVSIPVTLPTYVPPPAGNTTGAPVTRNPG